MHDEGEGRSEVVILDGGSYPEEITCLVAELKTQDKGVCALDCKRGQVEKNGRCVAAEKASAEVRDAAKHEAELIVTEAHHEARAVTRAAHAERARLFAEVRRVETLLRAALGMVEETSKDLPAASPAFELWPRREDTREFQAVRLPEEPEGEPKLPPVESTPGGPEDGSWAGRDFAWG